VTVDEHVLADAKQLGTNLSQVLEDELRKRVKEEKTRRWQEETRTRSRHTTGLLRSTESGA
jgi:post-segregation antitoxin (ccd killing protein)